MEFIKDISRLNLIIRKIKFMISFLLYDKKKWFMKNII